MDTVLVSEGTPAITTARDDALAAAIAAHGPVLLATARVITMDADEAQDGLDWIAAPAGGCPLDSCWMVGEVEREAAPG